MRVEIEIEGRTLAVGHDHAVGFFATVTRDGCRQEYDALAEGYDHERPIRGVLRWLVERVYTEEDLDDALLVYAEIDVDGEPLSAGARLALTIIEALKRAAEE